MNELLIILLLIVFSVVAFFVLMPIIYIIQKAKGEKQSFWEFVKNF